MTEQATCRPCRGEWVLKRKAQQIAEATARVGAAKRQKSAATDPAVAVRWEEELRQAAAEEAELIEERALFLEMMMEAPGERSSLPACSAHLKKAMCTVSKAWIGASGWEGGPLVVPFSSMGSYPLIHLHRQ